MEIPEPQKEEFTVYSKSGCINCVKVKTLLKDKNLNFIVIDCDEFVLEDKDAFLKFMYKLAGQEYKTFPMVFDEKYFVGGFTETIKHVEKILDFDLTFC